MRNPPPDFELGDHVVIKPMDNCPARIIGLELDREGWTVVVRYFDNSEAKTLKAFPDEVARPTAAACVTKERVDLGAWPAEVHIS